MSPLPAALHGARALRQIDKAVELQQGVELAIYEHGLLARYQAECDRQDADAAKDAAEHSLKGELELSDFGIRQAAGSQVGIELVARKVEFLSDCNNARLRRVFGA